jgi:hypothetical protein
MKYVQGEVGMVDLQLKIDRVWWGKLRKEWNVSVADMAGRVRNKIRPLRLYNEYVLLGVIGVYE